jgi:hypothetical protein
MKVLLSVIGVLLILVGLVWILQGVNILLGSMMSGHIQYSILGLVVAVIGVGLLIYANRRPKVMRNTDRPKIDK